jgi:hypothetical protein
MRYAGLGRAPAVPDTDRSALDLHQRLTGV